MRSFLVDLADVAEQMRGELSVQVMARRCDFETDAREIELMRFQRDHLPPSQAFGHGDRLVGRAARVVGVGNLAGDVLRAGIALESFDRLGKIVRVLGHDYGVERRLGIDQRPMIAIEDQAARSRHAPDANPVAVGQLDILFMMEDLQVVEADRYQSEQQDHERGHRRDA